LSYLSRHIECVTKFAEHIWYDNGIAVSITLMYSTICIRLYIKGRVHCFSMQVVMNCFLLNLEENLAQIRLVVFEKNAPLIPKNDVTEPKAS